MQPASSDICEQLPGQGQVQFFQGIGSGFELDYEACFQYTIYFIQNRYCCSPFQDFSSVKKIIQNDTNYFKQNQNDKLKRQYYYEYYYSLLTMCIFVSWSVCSCIYMFITSRTMFFRQLICTIAYSYIYYISNLFYVKLLSTSSSAIVFPISFPGQHSSQFPVLVSPISFPGWFIPVVPPISFLNQYLQLVLSGHPKTRS